MGAGVHGRTFGVAIVLAIAVAMPADAQDDAVPDGSAMDAIEAKVPRQPWYPDGYYDVRIAAEAQAAETLRDKQVLVASCPEGGALCYDPFDPLAQRINPDESDPAVRRYGNIALDISRLRQELALTGYPPDVYSNPLTSYERKRIEAAVRGGATVASPDDEAARDLIAAIETNRKRTAPALPRVMAYSEAAAMAQAIVLKSSGPSAGIYPAGKKLRRAEKLTLRAGDQVELLESGTSRTLRGPGVFGVGGTDGGMAALATASPRRNRTGAIRSGGGSTSGAVFQTTPPSGEVLLVSAFAFKLCVRKRSDPWDRFACKWNEVETGVAKPLSGRFVYQVRWPDGTVRKGTREIAPKYDTGEAVTVTFKKVGS
jgi:hypothetical protein